MMGLQIPARSGTLRRLLLLGGGAGPPRPYSTGDRRRRVIRESQQDEEDEAFLPTLNFGADQENTPLPPPPRCGWGAAPSDGAAAKEQPLERSAQKAVGETLLEKLKLGNGDGGAASAAENGAER
jgi:hypothetical protein